MVDVDAVADELYQEDPASFVSLRDARVGAARQEGDRQGAAAIKAFKRPSPPAWAVNLLARAHPDELDGLADLGARLRQAQASLSGEELRGLSRERHKFVVGLARQARSLAADKGHPLSANADRQVEETLNAALADPEAAVAVASGRLVRSLEHAGMAAVDLDGAVAGVTIFPVGPNRKAQKAEPGAAEPGAAEARSDASARARLEAEFEQVTGEAAAAENELRSVQETAGAATSALERASQLQDEADREVRRLEAELASARSRAETAKVEAALASRSRDEAERSLEATQSRVRAARERLLAIQGRRPRTGK
jgi:hypothetical protein